MTNSIENNSVVELSNTKNILQNNGSVSDNKNAKSVQEETKRIKSIDRFRGFCVFAMLIFQFLKNFENLGFLSRLADHSTETGIVILPGMTLADIIAPAFIFAIGMTFALSFKKWERLYGTKNAIIHYFERALSIIGVGTFLYLCNQILASFDDYTLNGFDWAVFAVSIVALIGLAMRLIGLVPKFSSKYRIIAEQVFYIALSILGIMNIIITFIDYVNIVNNANAIRFGYWVTLQGIGFAILVAFPFVKAKSWVKFLGASIIFIAFTIYHQIGDNKILLDEIVHGGVVGGFGWGAMLIFDMFIADLYFECKYDSLIASAFFFAVGVFLIQWLGVINMGSCSPTFILVSVGLSGVLFYCFDMLDKYHKTKFDPLVWWGKNPIIMFLVEFFVLGSYGEIIIPMANLATCPWWLAGIQGIVAVVALTAFTYWLSRSKKTISL